MSTTNHPNYNVIFSSSTDDWPTPVDFYERLDAEFGFILDVCSSTKNHKAQHFYALDHHDPELQNGLQRDWAADAAEFGGQAVWMNPPYGAGIGDWMTKARDAAKAGATVVCLVPVRSATIWWHDLVLNSGAEVRYVRGRLTFGDAKTAAPFASAVVIYRPTDVAGVPGPVGTIKAKLKSGEAEANKATMAAAQRVRRDKAPTVISRVIDSYTPRKMSTTQWAKCAPAVREAVTLTRPSNQQLARERMGALVGFLNTEWDGQAAPDLDVLLEQNAIARHLQTLTSAGRVAAAGSHLRSFFNAFAARRAVLRPTADPTRTAA